MQVIQELMWLFFENIKSHPELVLIGFTFFPEWRKTLGSSQIWLWDTYGSKIVLNLLLPFNQLQEQAL